MYSCCSFEIASEYCGWNLDIASVSFKTPCLHVSKISELSCAIGFESAVDIVSFASCSVVVDPFSTVSISSSASFLVFSLGANSATISTSLIACCSS